MAAFDWYQATIPAEPNQVVEAMRQLDAGAVTRQERGAHGYAHVLAIEGRHGPLARVLYGGTQSHPHAIVTGEHAQRGAEHIRASFPVHSVTRVDVREDFSDAGAFDRVLSCALTVASAFRVGVDTRGDHLLTKVGRSVYLGAVSSATRLCIYDKAEQLRARFSSDPAKLATVPDYLTRLEARVRPQTREAKMRFASIAPADVMGSSAWLRELWKQVVGLELSVVRVGKAWRQADDERAYAHLLAQYGRVLARMHADLGSWCCVGQQIGSDLAHRDSARAALRPLRDDAQLRDTEYSGP